MQCKDSQVTTQKIQTLDLKVHIKTPNNSNNKIIRHILILMLR